MSVEKRRLVRELHAPARRNFPRRRVLVRGRDDFWQADVVEMRSYTRVNKGYNYILTIIDVLRKYAWVLPFKSKNARHSRNLQTDQRKEFYNDTVQRLLKRYNVNHYSTYSVMKASVVERFNRTLKNDM